jgi:hypothetical protein
MERPKTELVASTVVSVVLFLCGFAHFLCGRPMISRKTLPLWPLVMVWAVTLGSPILMAIQFLTNDSFLPEQLYIPALAVTLSSTAVAVGYHPEPSPAISC